MMLSLRIGSRKYMASAGKMLAFLSYFCFSIGFGFLLAPLSNSLGVDVIIFGHDWGLASFLGAVFFLANVLLRFFGFVERSLVSHLIESGPYYALAIANAVTSQHDWMTSLIFTLPILENFLFHLRAIIEEFRGTKRTPPIRQSLVKDDTGLHAP